MTNDVFITDKTGRITGKVEHCKIKDGDDIYYLIMDGHSLEKYLTFEDAWRSGTHFSYRRFIKEYEFPVMITCILSGIGLFILLMETLVCN